MRGNPSLGITSLKTASAPRASHYRQDDYDGLADSMSILDLSEEEGDYDPDRYEQDESSISYESFAQGAATEINLAQSGVTPSYMNELIQDMWTKFTA